MLVYGVASTVCMQNAHIMLRSDEQMCRDTEMHSKIEDGTHQFENDGLL